MVKRTEQIGAGDLRWLVSLQRRIDVSDGYGNHKGEWSSQFRRRAYIGPMRGGESVIAGRLEGTAPTIIVVRYSSETKAITSDWRVVELLPDGTEGPAYAIRQAEDMERERQWITLLCERGVAA
ncbi:MAG: phage head closure protein [Flavobacteriaceae bacterium]